MTNSNRFYLKEIILLQFSLITGVFLENDNITHQFSFIKATRTVLYSIPTIFSQKLNLSFIKPNSLQPSFKYQTKFQQKYLQ